MQIYKKMKNVMKNKKKKLRIEKNYVLNDLKRYIVF